MVKTCRRKIASRCKSIGPWCVGRPLVSRTCNSEMGKPMLSPVVEERAADVAPMCGGPRP